MFDDCTLRRLENSVIINNILLANQKCLKGSDLMLKLILRFPFRIFFFLRQNLVGEVRMCCYGVCLHNRLSRNCNTCDALAWKWKFTTTLQIIASVSIEYSERTAVP